MINKQTEYQKGISTKGIILISAILIIILGLSTYSNSLNGKFIWDDDYLVRDNTYVKDWCYLPKIFTRNIAAGSGRESNFYRPLQVFSYMIDYSLWDLDARGYHLSNILLHILVALSIYWLVSILYSDRLLSLLTGILFVVHPIHTEVVAYISGRADSLVLLFMLFCFILYIKNSSSKKIGLYSLMLLSYTLALLSREIGLILPALLLLYHNSFKKKLQAKQLLSILSIALIYILLRLIPLRSLLPDPSYSTTLFQRLPGFFAALTNYIRLLFLPLNLHMEYGNKLFNLTDPRAILGVLILFSLLIYGLRKRGGSLISFSIYWFFITLLPVSNLYPINAYMAEHWLYLPSIGFFLLLASGLVSIYRAKGLKALAIILTLALLSFYSCLTIRQNTYWREPLAFYKRTLRYAPDSSRAHYNLGLVYKALNKNEEAIISYKRAIAIDPDCSEAYNNLGLIYHSLNKNELAIASYKKAIEINPDYAQAYNNLGLVYDAINNREAAIASYKKAIILNPELARAYNNLGIIYEALNKNKEAIALYKKAITIDPDYAEAYINLGLAYQVINKDELAVASYKEAITLNPELAQAYNNLCIIYFQNRQYKFAIEYCDKANELGFANPLIIEALKPYRKQERLGQ